MNKKRIFRKICCTGLGFALAAALTGTANADDTEVLIGAQTNPGDPNVVFLIDTSGSMASDVVVGQDYDPDTTYVGDCQVDRLYWQRESTSSVSLPSCTGVAYLTKSQFKCDAAVAPLTTTGRYSDRFAQWNDSVTPSAWEVLAQGNLEGALRSLDRAIERAGEDPTPERLRKLVAKQIVDGGGGS